MRLIDIDALEIGKCNQDMVVGHANSYNSVIEIIKNAPTIDLESLRLDKEKPLTIDELMSMVGEPVWVVKSGVSEWCILRSYHSPEVYGRCFIFTRRTTEKRHYLMDEYGKTWIAYRSAVTRQICQNCGAGGKMNNYNNSYDIGNVLNAISVLLGYQNLQENRQQSAYNDVHKANDEQAEMLLQEINKRFDEQNKILEKQNEILYNLLEEKNIKLRD